jgi:hypothetical protein
MRQRGATASVRPAGERGLGAPPPVCTDPVVWY